MTRILRIEVSFGMAGSGKSRGARRLNLQGCGRESARCKGRGKNFPMDRGQLWKSLRLHQSLALRDSFGCGDPSLVSRDSLETISPLNHHQEYFLFLGKRRILHFLRRVRGTFVCHLESCRYRGNSRISQCHCKNGNGSSDLLVSFLPSDASHNDFHPMQLYDCSQTTHMRDPLIRLTQRRRS